MATYKNKMMVTEKHDVQIVIIDDNAKRASDGYIIPYHRHFPETVEEATERQHKEEQDDLLAEMRQIKDDLQGE